MAGRTNGSRRGAAGLFLAHHLPLREIGQLQIFEKEIDKFVIGKGEAELVLALPSALAPPLPPPEGGRAMVSPSV